jgi:hypothetical protein
VTTETKQTQALIDRIVGEWADKGKLIEGGWQAYVATSGLAAAPQTQRREMHTAYFLGAQHLLASMTGIMDPDPDAEPTQKDMLRMSLIYEELEVFRKSILEPSSDLSPEEPPTTVQMIGDGPLEVEFREKMVKLAGFLDEHFNGTARGPARHTGFVLLVFPFHPYEGRANYISNGASREDIVTLFTEQIAYFKGAPAQKGRA